MFQPQRKLTLIFQSSFQINGSTTTHLKYLSKKNGNLKHLDIFISYNQNQIHLVQREAFKDLKNIPFRYLKNKIQTRRISSEVEGKLCKSCISSNNNFSLPIQTYIRDIISFTPKKQKDQCNDVPEEKRVSLADTSLNLISKEEKIKKALDTILHNQLATVSCLEGFGYTGKEILSATWQSAVSVKKGVIDGEWGDAFGEALFQHAQKNYDTLKDKDGKVSFLTALGSWSKEKYLHTAINFAEIKKEHRKKWDVILADKNTSFIKKAYGKLIAKNFFLSGMAAMASGGESTVTRVAPRIYDMILSKIDQEKKDYLMCLSPHAQQKYICRSLGHIITSVGGLKYLLSFNGSKETLAKMINDSFEKSKYKKALNKSNLSNLERIELAEDKIDRSLSLEEIRAVIEAHEIGSNESGKTSLLAGLGGYSSKQIAKKARRLKEAGFSKKERRILMEEGITGQINISPEELSQLALMKMDFMTPKKAQAIRAQIEKCKSDCGPEELANLVLLRDQMAYLQKYKIPQKLKEFQNSSKFNPETKQFFSEFQELCLQQMDCSLEKIQAFTRVFSEFDRIYKPNVLGALSIKAEDGFSFLDRFRDCLKSQMCIESSYSDFEDKIKNLNQTLRNCKNCTEEDYAFALSTRPLKDRSETQLFGRIMSQCASMRSSSQSCSADNLLLLETYRDYRIESPIVRGNMEDPEFQSRQNPNSRSVNKNIVSQNELGNKLVEKYDMEVVHNPRDKDSIAAMRPSENQAIEKYIEERALNPNSKPDYVFYHKGELKLVDAYDPASRTNPKEIAFMVTRKVYEKGQADHILINLAENVGNMLNQRSHMKKIHDTKILLGKVSRNISETVNLNQSNPRQLKQVYANIGTLDDPVIVEVYPNFSEELIELSLEQSKRLK